jgi:hypothetical protein
METGIDMDAKKKNIVVFFIGALVVSIIHFVFFFFSFRFSFPDLLEFWLHGYYLAIFRFDGLLIPYKILSLVLIFLGLKLINKKYAVVFFLVGLELMLFIGMMAASVLV